MEAKYEKIEKIYNEKVIPMAEKIAQDVKQSIIRRSKSDYYYTHDGKRFNTEKEAINHLSALGIETFKIADAFGGYNDHYPSKIVEVDGYLFALRFHLGSRVCDATNITFQNKDYIKILTKDSLVYRQGRGWYSNEARYEETPLNKVKLGDMWWKFDSDFNETYWVTPTCYNNTIKNIAKETKDLVISFYKDALDKDKEEYMSSRTYTYEFYEYIPKMFKNHKISSGRKDMYEECKRIKDVLPLSRINGAIVRCGDYIIIKDPCDRAIQFYNVKTNKRMIINGDGTLAGATKTIYISDRDVMTLYLMDKYGGLTEANFDKCFKDTFLEQTKEMFVEKDPNFNDTELKYIFCKSVWAKKEVKDKLKMAMSMKLNKFFEYILAEYDIRTSTFLRGIINQKGSLSKAFGLPNQKLRMINDFVIEHELSDYNPFNTFIEKIKNFDCLGLGAMDDETFTRIMKLCVYKPENKSWWYAPNYSEINQIYEHMENKTPKTFVKIIETYVYDRSYGGYASICTIYCDYLRMRESVIRYAPTFDYHTYKLVPEPMIVHVELRTYSETSWSGYVHKYTAQDQIATYMNAYGASCETLSLDDDRGVIELKLRPAQAVKYLHDQITELSKIYKEKIDQEEFSKALQRVKEWEYEDDNFMIISPKSIADLQREGNTLSHCVGSFASSIKRGTENVMFLRRKDYPDVPYYTIAISPNKQIEQIHCYRNGGLSKEAQETAYQYSKLQSYDKTYDLKPFLFAWCKKAGINAATIRESYGALGAH